MADQVYISCTNASPIQVYVNRGKITRIRPLFFDDTDSASWIIDLGNRKITPPRQTTMAPHDLVERLRVYSEDRIQYPLKRKDFDPSGVRNTENRGKSDYERISWDEALNIVADEMKRVRSTYGPEAITSIHSSHHLYGNIGYRSSTWRRFFHLLGFTEMFENPDSWEGWHWGSTHTYGFYWRLGVPEQYDLLEDALKNCEMVVYWSHDPDTTDFGFGGQEYARWRLLLREMGKKQIFIDPYCNYTAAILADKWIAPRPGTDSAMAEAIAYVWIKENTYDKEYVKTHTIGFEEFKDHILGKEDGTPRTPGWAEEITGIPARVITALAKEWAAKRTMLGCGRRGGYGSACREAYGTEWARLMVYLLAMQGLGKPGVNIWGANMGVPSNSDIYFPGYAERGIELLAKKKSANPVKQKLYRILFPDCILNPPVSWKGEGFCANSLEQQFKPYTYPMPGCSEVKMFYRYGGSFIGTMTETNKWVKAYQSPKLEFVVNQSIWMDPETGFADIILPACTNLERNDISEWGSPGGYSKNNSIGCNHRVIVYQHKAIEPVGESKSDYWIFTQLAERLGFKEDYTEGNTEEDWIKKLFEISDIPKYISWEEFQKKGYFIVPMPENYKPTPALRWFYENRECDTPDYNPKKGTSKAKELGTYSGKIEFVSQDLKQHFPDDAERPPLARYIPSWEGHESELAKKYPLQLISPHSRYSYHTHHDAHSRWLWDIPGHRIMKDGYPYHTTRIHPADAAARGINEGDIIKLYNDRGASLGIAQVTERVRPGTVHTYESSGIYDPLEKGTAYSVDRGGCINLITPSRILSQNAPGMAPNSCLIEITKWEI